MASSDVIAKMFVLFRANWPRYQFAQDTINVYARILADVPDELLEAACIDCLATCTWFPKVAEIRRAVGRLTITTDLTAGEAWALVIKYSRIPKTVLVGDGRLYRKALPENVQRALEAIGGWEQLASSDNYVADRARFLQSYEAITRRHEERRLMLPEVKKRKEIEGG